MPDTRYAVTDDGVHIAYQVIGDGPVDIVFAHSFVTHIELYWELPSFERLVRSLSSFARVILFDKRGVGLSDRLASVLPTLEARMDDLRAVLDAAGSERALLFGTSDGGAITTLFAATYPERSLGLLLWSGTVRLAWAHDYPWGMREEEFEERSRLRADLWGNARRGEESTAMTFAFDGERLSRDPRFVRWLMHLQRNAAAPGDFATFSRVWLSTDARSALPAIQVPAALSIREGWPAPLLEETEWTAAQIPGATRSSRFPDRGRTRGSATSTRWPWSRNGSCPRSGRNKRSSTGCSPPCCSPISSARPSTRRRSATARGSELVEQHHSKVRALLARFRGNEVDTAGDGFFATFDGPGRAVRCAQRDRAIGGNARRPGAGRSAHRGGRDDRREGGWPGRRDRLADRLTRRPVGDPRIADGSRSHRQLRV